MAPYTRLAIPSIINNGVKTTVDSGKMVTAILMNPYAPIFNMTPANSIEPAVGA